MDPNSWFYTLSAIPQTIASLIALSATFIIFKLNAIDSNINTDVYHIRIFLNVLNNNFEPYIGRKDLREILNPLKEEIKKLDSEKESLGLDRIIFENLQSACRYIISGKIVDWYPLHEKNLYKFITYKYDSLKGGYMSKNIILDYLKKTLILSSISVVLCLLFLSQFEASTGFEVIINNYCIARFILYFLAVFSIESIIYAVYSIFKISKIS
jgi:hypothetical protein